MRSLGILVAALALAGCVKKSTHQQIKTELFANNWYLSTARAVASSSTWSSRASPPPSSAPPDMPIIVVPDLSELPKLAKEPR